jgi:hypothetical protein
MVDFVPRKADDVDFIISSLVCMVIAISHEVEAVYVFLESFVEGQLARPARPGSEDC